MARPAKLPTQSSLTGSSGLTRGIPAKDKQHFEAKGVGHYGIFSGRKYREMIYPRIREFIKRNA